MCPPRGEHPESRGLPGLDLVVSSVTRTHIDAGSAMAPCGSSPVAGFADARTTLDATSLNYDASDHWAGGNRLDRGLDFRNLAEQATHRAAPHGTRH